MSASTTKKLLFSKPLIVLEVAAIAFIGFYVVREAVTKQAVEQEIARLEQEIGALEQNKDDLGALLDYVQTDAFVEQEARQKLNLVSEGEQLLVIPEVDAASASAPDAPGASAQEAVPQQRVLGASNAVHWWTYFFEHDQLQAD